MCVFVIMNDKIPTLVCDKGRARCTTVTTAGRERKSGIKGHSDKTHQKQELQQKSTSTDTQGGSYTSGDNDRGGQSLRVSIEGWITKERHNVAQKNKYLSPSRGDLDSGKVCSFVFPAPEAVTHLIWWVKKKTQTLEGIRERAAHLRADRVIFFFQEPSFPSERPGDGSHVSRFVILPSVQPSEAALADYQGQRPESAPLYPRVKRKVQCVYKKKKKSCSN